MDKKIAAVFREYLMLTMATALLIIGVYVFKFPNHFSFGGVTGIAVILAPFVPLSPSVLTAVINIVLLVLGFIFLGTGFGLKTVYVVLLNSGGIMFLERFFPMEKPLTNQPVLELVYAIVLPAVSAAILFNMEASSGGTDILAMILKKYTSLNIGMALMLVDAAVAVSAFFVYGPETGLFSVTGLLAKTLVIDTAIENINLSKYFTIVTSNPEPIVHFIHENLHRGATVYTAEGTYEHKEKTVIMVVTKRFQAVQLRRFVRSVDEHAFMMITNSSEIIGKGFRGLN